MLFPSKGQIKFLYEINVADKQQFKEYWNKTVAKNTSGDICHLDTIKNDIIEIFLISRSKSSSKLHQKLKLAKNKLGLFSCFFITSQTRNGDLNTFFDHENQATPPLISENWSRKLPKKTTESLKNYTRENVELGSVERLPVIAFFLQTG